MTSEDTCSDMSTMYALQLGLKWLFVNLNMYIKPSASARGVLVPVYEISDAKLPASRAGYFLSCLPCPKDTCPFLWVQYYKPEIGAKYYL